MPITLDGLALPLGLLWQDELEYAAAAATLKRTVQGRPVLRAYSAPVGAGRPVTLGGGHAWISRADLLTLQEWAHQAGRTMRLLLADGREMDVVFRHWEAPVIEAAMLFDTENPAGTERYHLRALKLFAL